MTNLTRWEPLSDLSTTMDRFFEDAFRPWRFFRPMIEETHWFPVEVSETDNDVEVKASLAGVRPEDIDISVHDDMLMVKAETRKEAEEKHRNYYRQEFHYGSMQRSIQLPCRVEADRAEAIYENGILSLKLPKSETEKPKQIKVHAVGQPQTIEASASSR